MTNFTEVNISLSSNLSNVTNTSGPQSKMIPMPSLAQRVISAIAMSVLIILSISGNSLVIASFYYYKKIRRSVTNCFIVSLAVSDLMVAFLSEPFWLSYQITQWTTFPEGWDINTLVLFWTILDISCAIASIVNLLFISIDRYFAIKSPLSHHTKMTPETSVYIIFGLWLYSIGTGCLFILEWHWKFLVIFIIGFVVPLIIMVFCYVGIMVVISSKARLSNQVGSTRLDKEFKTAKSLGVVTGSFVFCWLPFFIVSLTFQYCDLSCQNTMRSIPALAPAVKWLHYLNSCLNPIIYAFLNPTFKVAFRNLFRRCCTNPNNFNDDMTITTMIFPSSRRSATLRKKSHEDVGNGRIPNGKPKSRIKRLLGFKNPPQESLQDSSSDHALDKRVHEETYIEKDHEIQPCLATQPNGKEHTNHQRHVHYDDEFLQVNEANHSKDADSNSLLSDTNNNPSDNENPSSAVYKPLLKTDELDSQVGNDTSEISTFHDRERNQFYFYVDGQYIAEDDLKTSIV
ncbi:tyramine receptor 1 [Exaiptasia diaphana]|uniref:G-protein coupled receptors family 1 profile domain-containing protein n=1 Tax=Exaiptasia diaphana TaxID=2652724 RepID=A0A913X7Z5_EXADI|nr:tyramine receptor 1 [Exaiptasia diaphana]XP_020900272.1 tyramine receptor 1 [Exaiptasia diaphana]XP_028514808.1 tyramine receptor 1 [Exaiptasia diaphana]XP_028514809.1 tyramine receptor 1 [Exaiptasia diaphana]